MYGYLDLIGLIPKRLIHKNQKTIYTTLPRFPCIMGYQHDILLVAMIDGILHQTQKGTASNPPPPSNRLFPSCFITTVKYPSLILWSPWRIFFEFCMPLDLSISLLLSFEPANPPPQGFGSPCPNVQIPLQESPSFWPYMLRHSLDGPMRCSPFCAPSTAGPLERSHVYSISQKVLLGFRTD